MQFHSTLGFLITPPLGKLSSVLTTLFFLLLHTVCAQARKCMTLSPSSSFSSFSVCAVFLIVRKHIVCLCHFVLKVVSTVSSQCCCTKILVGCWFVTCWKWRTETSPQPGPGISSFYWAVGADFFPWLPPSVQPPLMTTMWLSDLVGTMWPATMDLRISIHWINSHPGNSAHCGLQI